MAEIYACPETSGTICPILQVRRLEKVYGTKDSLTHALNRVDLEVFKGEFVGIMGASGSGKTTLLNCISTIDRPTAGQILIEGRDIASLSKRGCAKFRRDQLGFVFQDSNLLNTLTAFENISLALTIKKTSPNTIPKQVEQIAETLGIKDVLQKYPYQMSGGQKQRVAAARAIVTHPSLILADEPTGALDSRSASMMLEVMEKMNRMLDATIIMVTHDAYAASFTNRVVFLRNGAVFNELVRGSDSREEFFIRIMEVITFLGGDASNADQDSL